MRELSLPRHSRAGATSVESLVARPFNAGVKSTRCIGIQVKAERVEESTVWSFKGSATIVESMGIRNYSVGQSMEDPTR